jgi:hypothetical protein
MVSNDEMVVILESRYSRDEESLGGARHSKTSINPHQILRRPRIKCGASSSRSWMDGLLQNDTKRILAIMKPVIFSA